VGFQTKVHGGTGARAPLIIMRYLLLTATLTLSAAFAPAGNAYAQVASTSSSTPDQFIILPVNPEPATTTATSSDVATDTPTMSAPEESPVVIPPHTAPKKSEPASTKKPAKKNVPQIVSTTVATSTPTTTLPILTTMPPPPLGADVYNYLRVKPLSVEESLYLSLLASAIAVIGFLLVQASLLARAGEWLASILSRTPSIPQQHSIERR
jgi:hypothetical protein